MKIVLIVLTIMLMAGIALAGEKEELLASQKALQMEWMYIQERAKTLQMDNQNIQTKLDAIAKVEADEKVQSEKDKKK